MSALWCRQPKRARGTPTLDAQGGNSTEPDLDREFRASLRKSGDRRRAGGSTVPACAFTLFDTGPIRLSSRQASPRRPFAPEWVTLRRR